MAQEKHNLAQKLWITAYTTLLFFVISSPVTYSLTGFVLGKWIAKDGLPTLTGLVLHSIVFALAIFGSMFLSLPSFTY